MEKSTKKLVSKLSITAFLLLCSYTTYTYRVPPFIWIEHALIIAFAWSEDGAGWLLSAAFLPFSSLYFLGKYATTWLAARRALKKRPRKSKPGKNA